MLRPNTFCENDFEILDGEPGFDKLRINDAGFFTSSTPHDFIYAHAPSWISLRTTRPLLFYGTTNASYHGDSAHPCIYRIDGTIVGYVWQSRERTRSILLPPGPHQLTIETVNPHGCHTLWKIDTP